MNWQRYKLLNRTISIFLILLHLFTFGPVRDALAFYSQSASYKLSAGTLTQSAEELIHSYTKLLLHYDGLDASSSFSDVIGKAVTANGDAQIDTTQSKFGGASALFDGTGDYLSIPDHADWDFGTGNFTVDTWVRFNTVGAVAFYDQSIDDDNRIEIFYDVSQLLVFVAKIAGVTKAQYHGTWAPSANVWYHIAVVRNGSSVLMFVDGTAISVSEVVAISNNDIGGLAANVNIGRRIYANDLHLNGWLDEFRISKGIARWTANFTPPTAPYSIDSDRVTPTKTWLDSLGEPAIGRSASPSYILNAGLIPIIQSSGPLQTQVIPNQIWLENTAKPNAFDLDDYFISDAGALTYTVSGNSKISVVIDSNTHSVSFSQAAAWFGTEKIIFTATDTQGNSTPSNEVTLLVQGVDNPPVLDYIADIMANENDLVTITPHATDLDNDPITYSFTTPLDATGKWQTDYTSSGTYTVTVTATDSTSLTDTQTVILNVRNVNRPPTLQQISDIPANEGDLVTVTPVASDLDNDALTFYYSAPLDTTGKWLTDYDDSGTYTASITVSDGIDTVSQSFNITVNNTNRPPQANLTLDKYTVNPNETIVINLSATDPDGDAMTFSLFKDGAIIASGNINTIYTTTTAFSNSGDHTIAAAVTDSAGLTTTSTKGVDVVDPNANRDYINPVMGDFNGDALSDLGLHDAQAGKWEICLSDAGVFRNAVDWLTNFGTSRDWQPIGGDFNGDAKTDIGIYNNTNGQLQIALSSGASFSSSGTWLTASFASYSWQPITGNFNADKYTDFALYNKDTGEVKVALGTGTGFGAFNSWITNFGNDYIAMAGDFNADSLTDLCLFKKATGEFKVAFSNTARFLDGSSWLSGFATNQDPILSDFNNDGLTDIGYWDKNNLSWHYAISTGATFIDKGLWLDAFGSSQDESATTGDFNADGVTDRATFDRDQIGILRWRTQTSNLKPADLLTEVDNSIGGKTQVSYTYAATADNPGLPFPVYVASQISVANNFPIDRTATYTQNFNFSGGYFDTAEREFRGFNKVKVTEPITGNYTETYFLQGKPGQDGALKGQIEKLIAYDGNNRQISQTLNTYEVRKSGPSANVLGAAFLIEQVTTVYEENTTSLATRDKFTYDNIGNVLEQTNEGDIAVTGDEKSSTTIYAQAYEGGGFNRPLEVLLKDKDANILSKKSFEYDLKGNLTKDTTFIFNPLTGEQSNPLTQYAYDSFGNLTSSTNALGATVSTDYETTFYAYPEKITNALGQSVQYVYDAKFGAVTSVTDTNGIISTTTYDSLGRALTVKNGLNQITVIYTYPDFNTKVSTNAIGLSSSEYIDGLGRKYKTVSSGEDGNIARQVISEIFYNTRGLTEKESLAHYIDEDPAQISYIRYEYDIRGRVKKTISDFPGTSKDAESSVSYINPLYTETIDPQGHKKGSKKDVFGNIIEVTEFTLGGVYKTQYQYDIQNNLIKTTDSKGNITQIFYDSIGRKLKMLDPDMGLWTYEYDILGNLLKQTDAKGQILTFEYDQLNRLNKKWGLTPQGSDPILLAEYIYDDPFKPNCIGRLSKVIDQSGSTEFFYDTLGREIKSIKTVDTTSYTVERTYDILDRLITLKYPDGEIINYNYDTNSGLLERVQGTTPYVTDIAYNAKGQIRTIAYGNNTQTNYTYGQDLRLSRILTQGASTLQDLNYIFDKNGNITTLTDNLRSNIRTFIYDDLDRLREAQSLPSPSGGYTTFTYQYDSIGNMTYKSDLGVMTYGSNAGPHALTSVGGYTYTYDANGNMVVGKTKTLEYDLENRLTKVTELGTIATFSYDGDGGRVRKATGSNSTTYIGSLFEIDSDGTTRKHIFAGVNRICTKDLVPQGPGPEVHYYHSDHLGSSSIITDSSGAQAQHLEYTPYGTLARNEGTDVVKHKFTGKELDATGLYYYGARYYDPEIGRFISADPTIQRPYDPQDLNRYAYCRNNPINLVDPSGLSWKSFWKKFGSTVLSIAAIVAAPFSAGLSLALWAGSTIWGGVQSAQAGQFGAWAAGFAVSMALGFALPAGDFANPFMQVGVGALRGAAIGAITGGVASAISGGSFGAGALQGAIGGAQGGGLSAFATSQQFSNWKEGKGFVANKDVKQEVSQAAKDGNFQQAIDTGRAAGGEVGAKKSVEVIIVEVTAPTSTPATTTVGSSPWWEPTPPRLLRLGGRILSETGHAVSGRLIGALGVAVEPGGLGKLSGIIAGGATFGKIGSIAGSMFSPGLGTIIGGVTFGIIGGAVGGSIGSKLDESSAGYLNYGE